MNAFANGAYPKPTSHDVLQLLIFPSPWKCEQGFSRTMTVKSKSGRKRSHCEFRRAVSGVIVRIDHLVGKRLLTSH